MNHPFWGTPIFGNTYVGKYTIVPWILYGFDSPCFFNGLSMTPLYFRGGKITSGKGHHSRMDFRPYLQAAS